MICIRIRNINIDTYITLTITNNNNIYTDSYTYSKNFLNSALFARKRAILTDWPP